jgi:hypothetical protein
MEAALACARKRWWQYEYQGRGVERIINDVALSTGIAIHHVLEQLTLGLDLEQALAIGVNDYRQQVEAAGLAIVAGESTAMQQVIDEQATLIEALGRGWAATRLPYYRETYDVVEVETEHTLAIADDLELMVRPDVVVRRKVDQTLFVVDFKSASTADGQWRKRYRYDQLTLSQLPPLEAALGEPVGGIIIEGLVKGYRAEYPKGSGQRQQNSPLIYGWRNPQTDEWASRYEWTCTAEHWTNGKRPTMCPGNKSHRLSGYYKAPVWAEFGGGVKGWLDWLLANDRETVEQQFVELPPLLRSEWELREWKASAIAQEQRIGQNSEWLNSMLDNGATLDSLEFNEHLARLFPRNTVNGNCLYCSCHDLCWGNASPDDPTAFRPRTFNHPAEAENDAD